MLLVVDLFIASGAVAALAIVVAVVGLVFVFRYDTTAGIAATAGLFVGVPILGYVLVRFFPVFGGWRRGQDVVADTVESMPVVAELAGLKGRYGTSLSSLRPAGVVDFGGRRIDCLSEGMMIEPGESVRCIDVRAGKVIVRRAEKLDLDDLETLTLN
jgi:membrane-bound ClpP family serine protease